MIEVANWIVDNHNISSLVSGGAAWADHVALEIDRPLSLWLPAYRRDIEIAQTYHRTFSRAIGRDTWMEVCAREYQKFGGFKDRNSKVADEAAVWLAMTFGDGPNLKDGGTADTVSKMAGKKGWHFNLNNEELYEI